MVLGTVFVVKNSEKNSPAEEKTNETSEVSKSAESSLEEKIKELEEKLKVANERTNSIESNMDANNTQIADIQTSRDVLPELQKQREIKDVTDTIEVLQESAKTKPRDVANNETYYSEIAESATLNYDYKEAPLTFYKQPIYYSDKAYDINEVKPFNPEYVKSETLCVDDLKNKFNENGQIEYEISPEGEHKKVYDENAFIGDSNPEDLGKLKNAKISVKYGERINWSKQKIARDIMQNFYDGHGHTLDGVKIEAKKTEDGKTKVRVSGDGVYSYKHLQELGSGKKEEDPHNAGGFGEGTRILVANMLAQNAAENVTYSSADWKMTFSAQDDHMKEKLDKLDNSIEGNYIEFETTDDELVDALFDSINYFEHSKNPDFKNLTYDSKDFGFLFLPNKEKGNIYFTQRFEFDGAGNWSNNVDNMTLILGKNLTLKNTKKLQGLIFRQIEIEPL